MITTRGLLVLGARECALIRQAMERARAKPVPLAEVMRGASATDQDTDTITLAERAQAPPWRDPEIVLLPGGYRLNVSFEEQPAGMCVHLSMSTARPGKVPHPEALATVCDLLDIRFRPARIWIEEFLIDGKPGGVAVNAVVVMAPAVEGHA